MDRIGLDGSGAGLGCGLGQLGLVLANSAAFVGSQNKAVGRAKSGQRARNGATGQGNKGTAAFQFFILGLGLGLREPRLSCKAAGAGAGTRLGLPRLVASKTSRPEKGREQKLCEGEQTAGQSQGSVQRKAGQERNRTMQQTSCGFPHRWFKFAI